MSSRNDLIHLHYFYISILHVRKLVRGLHVFRSYKLVSVCLIIGGVAIIVQADHANETSTSAPKDPILGDVSDLIAAFSFALFLVMIDLGGGSDKSFDSVVFTGYVGITTAACFLLFLVLQGV